jgi:flagellar biosynthesis/type III secretory pathway chaperone
MVEHDKFSADLMELEHLLVRQFRALQELLETSQKERAFLLSNDEKLMRVVEDKEVLLDQLGLIEDSRRKVVQDLSQALKIQSDSVSVGSLLPFLKPDDANRIGRLAEGVITLAGQTRELNEENHALALVKLDWVKAAQSVFIGMLEPEVEYRPANSLPPSRESGWGTASVEVRA